MIYNIYILRYLTFWPFLKLKNTCDLDRISKSTNYLIKSLKIIEGVLYSCVTWNVIDMINIVKKKTIFVKVIMLWVVGKINIYFGTHRSRTISIIIAYMTWVFDSIFHPHTGRGQQNILLVVIALKVRGQVQRFRGSTKL